VQNVVVDRAGLPAARRAQATDRLVSYSMSLLGSRMSAFPPSDLALGETLARKLARAHGIDAPVLQLHELLALLRAGSDDPEAEGALAHEHRLAALHLLAELAGSGRASADGAVGAAAAVVAVGFGRTATGRAGEAGAEGGGRFGLERGFALPPNSLSLGEAEVSAVLAQRFEAVVNSPSAHAEAQANGGRLTGRAAPFVGSIWRAAAHESVAESELVRSTLFAMQAISSKHIRFASAQEQVVCMLEPSLPAATRTLIGRLCELGVLYAKCERFVGGRGGTQPSGLEDISENGGSGEGGFVRQALCAAMRNELDDYFRLLSLLDAERLGVARAAESAGGGNGRGTLTLRKLMLWAHEPRLRLQMMCTLVDQSEGVRGGALANSLGLCAQHGDSLVRSYVGRFCAQAGAPLLRMLQEWLSHGSAQDQHSEFFIEARRLGATSNGAEAEALWHSTFALRTPMLPTYISAALATRVLQIGKSVRLLRECAPPAERGWVASRLRRAPELRWGDAQGLEVFVETSSEAIHPRIKTLLVAEHGLLDHLRALRGFLLLGQGDFVQLLMDALIDELGRPATELHRHSLLAVVDGAVRASTAAVEHSSDALARLDIHLRAEPMEDGWSAFSLTYSLGDSPVAAVVTAESLRAYRRLFCFLWRLKRAEHLLAGVWKKHTTALRLFRELHSSPPMRALQRLRHELLAFVHNTQHYAMAEVLEVHWSELQEAVHKAKDVDSLCKAHAHFLASVGDEGLHLEETSFTEPVHKITQIAIEFADLQQRLYDALLERDAERRAERERAQRNTKAGRWATLGNDGGELRAISAEFEAHIEELRLGFYTQFDRFFNTVSRHPSQQLSFLAARLDFNGFHAARHDNDGGADGTHAGWTGGLGDESPVM